MMIRSYTYNLLPELPQQCEQLPLFYFPRSGGTQVAV